MSQPTEVRRKLLAQQAALVAALTACGELPSGFDVRRLQVAAASLTLKRARSVARVWRELALALGPRYRELFAQFSRSSPLLREGGPLADGRSFARWLDSRGDLPEAGRLQAIGVDLRYATSRHGLVRRRTPTGRIAWLPRSRRLVVALYLPLLGVRWLSIPLGRGAKELL
jgi:hypothetical protein